MEDYRLTARLEFDLEHLLWKANVHSLSSKEIEEYYNQLRRQYLEVVEQSEFYVVQQEFINWEQRISDLMEHHRKFPSSLLCQ